MTVLNHVLFFPRNAISWINSALIYWLKSRALNLRADTSRCTTYVQANTSISLRACNVTCDTKKWYYLHDYRADWHKLIPFFSFSRAGHARSFSHTFYVRDNDFNVSINHDQAEARFMTAPRSYSVWKVSDLIRKDEGYPAEPVLPEIIFRGWL